MGLGAIFGGAVDQYDKSSKIARDQAWEDEVRTEARRQRDQDIARDGAGKQAAADANQALSQSGGQEINGDWVRKFAPNLSPDAANELAGNLAKMKQDDGTPIDMKSIMKAYQAAPGAGMGPGGSDMTGNMPPPAAGIPAPSQPMAPQVQGSGLPTGAPPITGTQGTASPVAPGEGPQGFDISKATPQQMATIMKRKDWDPATMAKSTAHFAETGGIPGSAPAAPSAPEKYEDYGNAMSKGQMPVGSLDNLRSYTGADGKSYATTNPDRAAKPSEIMLATAHRMMNLGDVKSLELGTKLQEHAMGSMKQEVEQEINQIVHSGKGVPEVIGGLVGMLGDSSLVPGSFKVAPKPDGTGLVLVHKVPGQDQPFVMPIPGKTIGEAITGLANQVRMLHDPALYEKNLKNNIDQQKVNQEGQYQDGHLQVMRDNTVQHAEAVNIKTQAAIDIAASRASEKAAHLTAGAHGSFRIIGTDTDGAPISYNQNDGKYSRQDGQDVKDAEIFKKLTGEKDPAGSKDKPMTLDGPNKDLIRLGGESTFAGRMHVQSGQPIPLGVTDSQYEKEQKKSADGGVQLGSYLKDGHYVFAYTGGDGKQYTTMAEAKNSKAAKPSGIPAPASAPNPFTVGTGIPTAAREVAPGITAVGPKRQDGKEMNLKVEGYKASRTFDTLEDAVEAQKYMKTHGREI